MSTADVNQIFCLALRCRWNLLHLRADPDACGVLCGSDWKVGSGDGDGDDHIHPLVQRANGIEVGRSAGGPQYYIVREARRGS